MPGAGPLQFAETAIPGIGGIVNTLLSPMTEALGQAVHADQPITIPTIDQCIKLGLSQLIQPQYIKEALKANGVDLGGNITEAWDSFRPHVWQGLIELSKPVPDINQVYYLAMRGLINDDTARQILTRHGVQRSLWDRCLEQYRVRFTPNELYTLRNREIIDDTLYTRLLRAYGGWTNNQIALADELRFLQPPPSDLITFGVKEAFDLDTVYELGYNQDMPAGFVEWMRKAGFGKSIALPFGSTGEVEQHQWSELYWWSHWRALDRTNANEFYHRARGNPDDAKTWRIPGLRPFTRANLDTALRVSDVPLFYRPYFEATSFRLVGDRQLRWAYQFKVIDKPELIEQFQDRGYNKETAIKLADVEEKRLKESKLTKARAKVVRAVSEAYSVGTLTLDQATTVLKNSGVEDDELSSIINSIDLAKTTKLASDIIASARASYLAGVITADTAIAILSDSGIALPRATQYIAEWRAKLTFPRKQLATATVLKYYRIGVISRAEAIQRISNLGYADAELILQIAATERDIELDLLREQAKVERDAERQRRAQERLVEKLRAEHRRAIAELERYGNAANVRRWLGLGLIDDNDARQFLTAIEWPEREIELLIQEVHAKG